MKYDTFFTKNCYFCGDEFTKGVLYRVDGERKKDAVKMRICKKHLEKMKKD